MSQAGPIPAVPIAPAAGTVGGQSMADLAGSARVPADRLRAHQAPGGCRRTAVTRSAIVELASSRIDAFSPARSGRPTGEGGAAAMRR